MPAKRAPAATAEKNAVVNVALEVGDWIDVMDSEGTWNVAQILSFPNAKEVEVKYDGWGSEYNEVLSLNGERVAPYHTYTWSVKCWAKYKNWPWWPSIVTIRSPGTKAGQTYLTTETRLFVDFLDRKDFTKRCRSWVDLTNIKPFDDHFDDRRKRTSGTDFETSLSMALKSSASIKFPPFSEGTLPKEFERAIADPVKSLKKNLGMRKWAGFFNSNLSRHRKVYMYKSNKTSAVEDDDDDDDDDDDLVIQFHDLSESDGEDKPRRPRSKGAGKGPTKKARTGAQTKGVKTSAQDPVVQLPEPVVVVEDSAAIIEGPHAPSPSDEAEEPIYLPALDDQVESDAPSAAGDAKAPVDPSKAMLETVAETGEPEKAVDRRADAAVLHMGDQVESGGESQLDVTEKEGSKGPVGDSVTAEDTGEISGVPEEDHTNDDNFSLEMSGDDDREESIAIDSTAQSSTSARTAGVEVSDGVQRSDPKGVSADDEDQSGTRCACENSAPESRGQISISDKSAESTTAEAVSPTLEVLREISESLVQPELRIENDSRVPKSRSRKRKSAKSLADERIAAAQAALAEHDEAKPATKKVKLVQVVNTGPDAVAAASTANVADQTRKTANEVESTNSAPLQTADSIVTSIDGTVSETNEQDTSRRSSMRAGAKGKDSNKNSRLQGKTPVWVLTPPKFDSAFDKNSNGRFRPPTPVLPPPFSSLSLFHSPGAFSLNKWFKCSEPVAK